jgi:putative tryptophan/tyrosine transport system substrate-binding protein
MHCRLAMAHMRRRDLFAMLGGAAVAWPGLLAAQQTGSRPTIGFMSGTAQAGYEGQKAAFLAGLREAGLIAGDNVAIEYRWADNRYDALSAFAQEFVARRVAVIAATGVLRSPLAAKATTMTIPIVFTDGGDPVRDGLVSSLSHPDGNITGVTLFTTELQAKRLQLIHDLVPSAGTIGLLLNPDNPDNVYDAADAEAAAHRLGVAVVVANAISGAEIAPAFAKLVDSRAGALIVGGDPLFLVDRAEVIALAGRYALPTVYSWQEDAMAGGLLSYGPPIDDMYHAAGGYVGRVLRGAKPTELPVQQPSQVLLVINLKTAKALDLAISPTLMARADEVIE